MNNKYGNPWQTLSTRLIYENPWIRVREDQVIHPDGNPGIYGVVEFHGAVGVLPVDQDGFIHLVGQYRYTIDRYSWEIVEGGRHPNESPVAAGNRELKEELGIEAGKLELLLTSHLSNSITTEEAHIYLATDLTRGQAEPEGTELLESRIVTFDEALKMVMSGEITDSMSQIAILHYATTRPKFR